MLVTRIATITLLFAFGSASVASAHGTERRFDTEINDRGGPIPPSVSGGSPAFTLMLIDSSSRALLNAAEEAQPDVTRKQALRLSELVEQLRRRSQGSALPIRERLTESTAFIAQSVLRIGVAVKAMDTPTLRLEIAQLDRLVASMQDFLRKTAQL